MKVSFILIENNLFQINKFAKTNFEDMYEERIKDMIVLRKSVLLDKFVIFRPYIEKDDSKRR